jgi:hypothetical protein
MAFADEPAAAERDFGAAVEDGSVIALKISGSPQRVALFNQLENWRYRMNDTTHVFISYAREDTIIAHAIKDQLTLLAQSGAGAPALECFLDTESIDPARRFEPIIRAALEDADWLIVVFTGAQSVYCARKARRLASRR